MWECVAAHIPVRAFDTWACLVAHHKVHVKMWIWSLCHCLDIQMHLHIGSVLLANKKHQWHKIMNPKYSRGSPNTTATQSARMRMCGRIIKMRGGPAKCVRVGEWVTDLMVRPKMGKNTTNVWQLAGMGMTIIEADSSEILVGKSTVL